MTIHKKTTTTQSTASSPMEAAKTVSLVVIAGFCLLVLAQCGSYVNNMNRVEECKSKYGYYSAAVGDKARVLNHCSEELFGRGR